MYDPNLPPTLSTDSFFLSEEKKELKRYVVTTTFYIYAEDDEHAREISGEHCKNQIKKNDDHCTVEEIGEQKFGTTNYRII